MIVFTQLFGLSINRNCSKQNLGKKNTHLWSQKLEQRFIGVHIDVVAGYIDVFDL